MSPLEQVVSRLDIADLLAEYAYCVDANRIDELVDLFTEDCDVAYGRGFSALGHEALRATMSGIPDFFAATSHHITNIVVRFDDRDRATVRAVVYAWHRYVRDRPDSVWLGYYDDTVVRTNGRWRIARLRMQTTGAIDHHLPEGDRIPFPRR